MGFKVNQPIINNFFAKFQYQASRMIFKPTHKFDNCTCYIFLKDRLRKPKQHNMLRPTIERNCFDHVD